jgi:hypothetical protein
VNTPPAPETELAPSGEGTVVLDIGGDSGAAVIFTPASLDGSEIEIRPVGEPWTGTHTGVRQRNLRDGARFAAVFGTLPAGEYQLRVRGTGSEPIMGLAITGGIIAEDRWPVG